MRSRSVTDSHLKDLLKDSRPAAKAYALGYASAILPRIPAVIGNIVHTSPDSQQRITLLKDLLLSPTRTNGFPMACAIVVAGATLLPSRLRELLSMLKSRVSPIFLLRIIDFSQKNAIWFCSYWSAWLAFRLLNNDERWSRRRAVSGSSQAQTTVPQDISNQEKTRSTNQPSRCAGKTIDFTLFAVCRALDVMVISIWKNISRSNQRLAGAAPRASLFLRNAADPAVFVSSSAIVMWSWFYAPERLPKTYVQWISKIAQLDSRVLNALRLCRRGDLVYGSENTADADLPSLCKQLNMPEIWGNPAVVVPIPCELYHSGAGNNCEVHAAQRIRTTFQLAMRLYLPLQFLSLIRRPELSTIRLFEMFKSAARSSSFLAAFVGLFYYAVCLSRTRIGPRLFPSVTRQGWDSGLCVLAGCLACGWSILLENTGRRQEMASFVAPRALATLLPRVYDKQFQRREQIAFSLSVATIMFAVQKKQHKSNIRGTLGGILAGVIG